MWCRGRSSSIINQARFSTEWHCSVKRKSIWKCLGLREAFIKVDRVYFLWDWAREAGHPYYRYWTYKYFGYWIWRFTNLSKCLLTYLRTRVSNRKTDYFKTLVLLQNLAEHYEKLIKRNRIILKACVTFLLNMPNFLLD